MIACLTVTAAVALHSQASGLRAPLGRVQGSIKLVADRQNLVPYEVLPAGWTTGVDQESGSTYYCNEQGECQWEMPQMQGGQQAHAQNNILPVGWTTGVDPASGSTFFFNEQTGESQWEPPEQQGGHAQQGHAQTLPAGWVTGVDPETGSTFYFNEQTGESLWEPPQQSAQRGTKVLWNVRRADGKTPWISHRYTDTPRFAGKYALRNGEEAVLGRWDVDEKKPTRPWVSREQCALKIADDGTPTLVSRGKAPTGWRTPGDWPNAVRQAGAIPWQWLGKGEERVLADGDQVSVDYQDPEGSVLTCKLEQ